MIKLKRILHSRFFIKIFTIVFLVLIFIFTKTYKYQSKYNLNNTTFIGIVTKISKKETKYVIELKAKEKLLLYYYTTTDLNFDIGDTIKVKGMLTIPPNNTIPNIFNYRNYLYYNHIYYILEVNLVELLVKNESILYEFKKIITSRINSISSINNYLNTFILGNKDYLDKDTLKSYQTNGISHLFSISGMHISLFTMTLLFILKRISYNRYYNYSVITIFLLIYIFFVGFTASAIRTLIMFIVFTINKLFNLKLSQIDLALISLIILLTINPFYIYNISFQYSYLISFTIILFNKKTTNKKNYFFKLLYISYLSFLISFPITIYNYYQINFFSIIYNLLFIPLVSLIIFPLSIIVFLFPFLSFLLTILIKNLESLSLFLSNIKIFTIIFSKPNIILIIFYYIVIFLTLYNKKILFLFIITLIIHQNFAYFYNKMNIIFLDVGQGDSVFIRLPHNKGNILIDTGGLYSEYSLTDNKLIPYFHSVGITKLDYLILTHGDYDHMKESLSLITKIDIDNVIFNKGNYNELEKELILLLDKHNINYNNNPNSLELNNYKFDFINTNIYDNENDNSSVIYFEYNLVKVLLMSDASTKVEEDIIKKYKNFNIDILKVGHHGSKTSSSKEFINYINPINSIISVGKNNIYKLPNQEVVDNLSKTNIYRTDTMGSILFKIFKNKYTITTYPA